MRGKHLVVDGSRAPHRAEAEEDDQPDDDAKPNTQD
jgi:hypothetical protein